MQRAGQAPFRAKVEAARARVDAWRKSRQGRQERMPEALWNSAVELARVQGINPIARALRLDYYSLKERVAGRQRGNQPRGPSPVFLDLGVGSLPSPSTCVVEMQAPGGARITVRLPDAGKVDLVSLARLLLRRRR